MYPWHYFPLQARAESRLVDALQMYLYIINQHFPPAVLLQHRSQTRPTHNERVKFCNMSVLNIYIVFHGCKKVRSRITMNSFNIPKWGLIFIYMQKLDNSESNLGCSGSFPLLTLLVLGFQVHSGIWSGIVPTNFETLVKSQVFVQFRYNKSRKVDQGLIFH